MAYMHLTRRWFDAVKSGEKTVEIRHEGKNIHDGDIITFLREEDRGRTDGEQIRVFVLYVKKDYVDLEDALRALYSQACPGAESPEEAMSHYTATRRADGTRVFAAHDKVIAIRFRVLTRQ